MMSILNDAEFYGNDNVRKNFIYKGQLRKILTILMTVSCCSAMSKHPYVQATKGSTRLSITMISTHDFESNQNIL